MNRSYRPPDISKSLQPGSFDRVKDSNDVALEPDLVAHPPHYNAGKIECIEFIEDQGFGPGFCIGNAIKYIARAGRKNPEHEIEDLEKAVWYLKRHIEMLRSAREGRDVCRPNEMKK